MTDKQEEKVNVEEKLALANRQLDALLMGATELEKISVALGQCLVDVCNHAPMGAAVDISAALSKAYEEVDAMLTMVGKRLSYVKEVTLPERFDEEQVTTFNTERFRVTATQRIFASIIGSEKEAAHKWLEDNGYGDLIKPTVNASSLSSVAKEIISDGKELPDDLFSHHFKRGVSITVKRQQRG